jgi:hypothetical protein
MAYYAGKNFIIDLRCLNSVLDGIVEYLLGPMMTSKPSRAK